MSALSDLRADLELEVANLDLWFSGPRSRADGVIFGDALDRLRHILDDRDILDAPTTSEIIAHLEADGTSSLWNYGGQRWIASNIIDPVTWHNRLAKHGDLPQPGYRLAPLPPATKRVRLDQLVGEKLPGQADEVFEVHNLTGGGWAWAALDERAYPLDVADDGTVEVQA